MASRGRRYDGEPKLNVKKVLAVLIILAVIVMCIVLIVKFATDDSSTETKTVANSYITVFSGNKWGVINSKGETIIQPTYDDMIIIPDPTKAVFIVQSDVNLEAGTYNSRAINDKGEEIFTSYQRVEALQNIDSSNMITYDTTALKVFNGEKYGLINFNGTEILSPTYDSIMPLSGVRNSFVTSKDGLYGLVDNSGNVIIDNLYTEISSLTDKYEDGYVVRDQNGNYGLINYNKQQVLECKYSEIKHVSGNNLYAVRENGNLELINEKGEVLIGSGFEDIINIASNNVIFLRDNKYGVMSSDGTVLIEPTYDELTYAFDGNYVAKKEDSYGIINTSNETKVEFSYSYITYMSDESIIEADKANGSTDLMDTSFNVKVTGIVSEINTNKGYVKVRVNNENKYYNFRLEERTAQDIFTTNTLFLSRKDGKYGYVNKEGIVVVDYIYDDATEQNDYGYVAVKQNGVWGALDQNGNVIVSPSYELAQNTVISFIGKWHLAPDLNANYYTDVNE